MPWWVTGEMEVRMRFLFGSSALVVALGMVTSAHAEVQETDIRFVVGPTYEACAIEITVTRVVDDLINGSETLTVDGADVASFADVAPAMSGVSRGNSVLFGSPSFELWASFTPDALLSDKLCASLGAGSEIGFRGSFGADAGSLTLPSDIGMHAAYDGNSLDDLAANAVVFSGLGGEVTLGDGVVPSDCGCASGGTPSGAALSLLGLLALARTRRRVRA